MLAAVAAASATAPAATIPAWLDYAALVVGSLAGTATAATRKLDLVGHVGLSLLCGLGGGLIRDVVMQVGTDNVYMLSSTYAIVVCVTVGICGFLFPGLVDAHPHALEWLDIASVGLFCVAGTEKALNYGLNPAAVILMGTLTGVGGGMLRDVTLGDVPRIFQSSNLYATCAILGSVVYFLCARVIHTPSHASAIACIATVVVLRRLSLRFDVQTTDTASVEHHVRSLGNRVRTGIVERGGRGVAGGGDVTDEGPDGP